MFEHLKAPLIPRSAFVARVIRALSFSILFVAGVLLIGVLGFRWTTGLSWLNAFVQAAMFFGGLGSEFPIVSWEGKIFASLYSIFCPFAVVASISILLLPLLHRFLHKLHLEKERE